MMEALQRVKDAAGVRHGRTSFKVKCPAHEDGTASLSVTHTDGKVLLNCFAGCSTDAILAKWSMASAELFDDYLAEQKQDGPFFEYHDEAGAPLYRMERVEKSGGKEFYPHAWNGAGWNKKAGLGDGRRVLYRLPAVRQAIEEGRAVWFVEGEKDVHTMARLGFVATTNPFGAKSYSKGDYAEQMRGAKRVYILRDNDPAGEALQQQVARSLFGIVPDVRLIELPVTGKGEDVTDYVERYGGTADALKELAKKAPVYAYAGGDGVPDLPAFEVSEPGFSTGGQMNTEKAEAAASDGKPDRVQAMLTRLRVVSAKELGEMDLPPVGWVVENVLPEGTTVLSSAPKKGKTRLAIDIAYAVAKGGRALGKVPVKARRVLYLAMEGGMQGIQGYLKQLSYGEPLPENLSLAFDWPDMQKKGLDEMYAFVEAFGDTGLIIIDTLKHFRGPAASGNSNAYNTDYEALTQIAKIKGKTNIDVLVLHHNRKAPGAQGEPLERVGQSYGLTGAVDNILLLDRQHGQFDAKLTITPRYHEESEQALTFKDGLWTLEGDAAQFAATTERQAILDLIEKRRRFMGAKEIAEALDKKRPNIQKMLGKLCDDEHMLSRRSGGKYGLHPLKFPRWEPKEEGEEDREEDRDRVTGRVTGYSGNSSNSGYSGYSGNYGPSAPF